MSRFGRDEKEELLDRRAAVFSGLRVVVCDTETTGLNTSTSRIVSAAVYEVQQGRVLSGYATLVDPDLPHIGASHIHHITNDVLRRAQAPSFEVVGPRILEYLRPRVDATVVLAGYNVIFDALLLHNEFTRIGLALPGVQMLDVRDLAREANVSAASRADLVSSLGLDAHDAHSSIGDTSVTTEALLRLTDQLHEADPDFRIEPLLVPFDPSVRITRRGARSGRDEEALTPEHLAAHDQDLTHKARREKSLRVCIDQDCPDLIARTQDGVIDAGRARQVADWIITQTRRADISRVTRGRLLSALSLAAGQTDDGTYIRDTYKTIDKLLPTWGPCTPGGQCDRCADNKGRTCRFVAARYGLVAAFLYQHNELSPERAQEFLPYQDPTVKRGRGRPRTGWFGELVRAGDLDTAGYGAQVAAQAGPQARTPGHERAILAYAWDKGSRNALLADRYSHRILADGSPAPARPHLDQAAQVCIDALAVKGTSTASVYDRLTDRLTDRLQRTQVRKANPPKSPPNFTRNARKPRTSRLAVTPPS